MNNFVVGLSNTSALSVAPVWLTYPALCAQYSGNPPLVASLTVTCSDAVPAARFLSIQTQGDALCMCEVEVYPSIDKPAPRELVGLTEFIVGPTRIE